MRKENTIEQALRRAGKSAGEQPGSAKRTQRESAEAALRLTRRALDEDLIDISYATLDSPFGPLRGDFGYVLSKATSDQPQVFQLTLQTLL